jgi:CBS domain-containing protein
VSWPAGQPILRRDGPPGAYLYLVRSGAVRLEREGRMAQVLEEGDVFGATSLLRRSPSTFDVITVEATELYQVPGDLFRQLLERPAFAEFFLKGPIERLRGATSLDISPLAGDLTTPAGALIGRPPVMVDPAASVGEVARTMRRAGVSSALVSGDPPGIITDRDLRSRVLAEGLGPETPASQVMSQPLKSLAAETPVYGALLFMLQETLHHLPLTERAQIVGVITDTDLLRHQVKSPLYLLKRIEKLAGPDAESPALTQYALEIAGTVESLFEGGLDVVQIGRVIASLNDALSQRLLSLAEAELGPAPTPYAWIVFGSEGRLEQTLLTDQDNALIYEEDSQAAQTYFETLAGRVVGQLIRAGFPACPGGYMATNWRYPLAEWERRFESWIETPEPQALLEAAIFFDFRRVHGELDLTSLETICSKAGERGVFLAQMARSTVQFEPPLGFFRRIRAEAGGVDLKKGAISPIVGLARLYALQGGAPERSTVARLEAAGRAGALSQVEVELLTEAFRFGLHLRLREQLRACRAGQAPGNQAPLDSLSSLEQRHLKDAFLAIREAQEVTAQVFQVGRLG